MRVRGALLGAAVLGLAAAPSLRQRGEIGRAHV